MNSILAEQVLAALINAPADVAERSAQRIEPADFETWTHQRIFEALLQCALADHQEPGSVIIQINKHLIDAGHYTDQDNGLRNAVENLVGVVGHPEQLTGFVDELLEQRFRRAVGDYADSLVGHADSSPLEDVDAALRRITELRRLRARTSNQAPLQAVPEGKGVA